jgi:hypothetical protein
MRAVRWVVRVLVVLVVTALVAPVVLLDRAVTQARSCFAAIEGPRGAALPDCRAHGQTMRRAGYAPWTARPAELLLEELGVRWSTARFLDAAVGTPDRGQLRQRLQPVADSARALGRGSARLRLDRLGDPLPAPQAAELAASVGDRASLLRDGERRSRWQLASYTLDAALLEGELDRATELAASYGELDNEDLALRSAALRCLGGHGERALEAFATVEKRRSEERKANFSRHFGDVRAMLEACAALVEIPAPAMPHYGHAGDWEPREQIMAVRLRRAEDAAGCKLYLAGHDCADEPRVGEALVQVQQLLASGRRLRFRLELLALMVPGLEGPDGVAELARPRDGEPSVAQRVPWRAADMVAPGGRDRPLLAAERLEVAAARLALWAEEDARLAPLAGAVGLLAARAFALRGERATALRRAERAGRLVGGPAGARLARAAVLRTLGQHVEALAALDGDSEGLDAATASDAAVTSRLLLERAELQALLGRSATPAVAAARRLVEQSGAAAPGAALPGAVSTVAEPLEWIELAAGPPATALPSSAPLRFPWVEGAAPGTAARAAGRRARQQLWRAWLAGDSATRRAARYRLFRQRGDAPATLVAYTVLLGRLCDSGQDVDTWLDAALALDARRMPARSYAWARSEAARWLGDDEHASAWRARWRRMQQWAGRRDRAELFQQIGL